MKHIALIVILTLTACTLPVDKSVDYEDARRSTIEAWEEVIGRVSDECYDRSVDAMVMETGRFPESCIPPIEFGKYVGCYMPTDALGIGGDMIYIYEDRADTKKADTAVHEYIHLLATCELHDGDILHLDERLWDDFGADTVEAVGCANLRF